MSFFAMVAMTMTVTGAHLMNLRESSGSGCGVPSLSVLHSRSLFKGQRWPVKVSEP